MTRECFLTLLLAACATTPKFEDLNYAEPFAGDFEIAVQRAKLALQREFRHLDPDQTDEANGEIWTLWRVQRSQLYRETTRMRAHVRIERLKNGKLRVGAAVFSQLNDNIENPSSVEEAKWVSTTRLVEKENLLRDVIAQSYKKFEPSDDYKARTSDERRDTPRPDLVDRYKDVDLESGGIDPDRAPPPITGPDKDRDKPKR
ncbi:MAG: hypothetical protein ACT4PV_13350 [Planctomycetaceae bacterium]